MLLARFIQSVIGFLIGCNPVLHRMPGDNIWGSKKKVLDSLLRAALACVGRKMVIVVTSESQQSKRVVDRLSDLLLEVSQS
jgi:hypothetical protein